MRWDLNPLSVSHHRLQTKKGNINLVLERPEASTFVRFSANMSDRMENPNIFYVDNCRNRLQVMEN